MLHPPSFGMCSYILLVPRCGHGTMLLSLEDCPHIFEQLMRINDPAAWEGDAVHQIPFDVPDECCPHSRNIHVQHTDGCLGRCGPPT